MAKQKSAAELRAENRLLRSYRNIEGIASVLREAIRWGGAAFIAYCGYLSVNALAGEKTTADIGISILSDFRVSETLAWIFGSSSLIYGWRQRKLRKDTIERVHSRTKLVEQELDPNRSSSQLTRRGDTRPEDE